MIRPPRDLNEVEHLLDIEHDTKRCRYCREGPMGAIRPDDILRFEATGVEATGCQLSKKAAGERLHRLTMQALRRSPQKSYSQAFQETSRINREIVRAYLGLE